MHRFQFVVSIFSPGRFGLHEIGAVSPCLHIAPLDTVGLGPKSTYRYRYWLMVGDEAQIAATLHALWNKYSGERAELAL
jgi:hypothetical protein